jgi:Spondin_N
MAARTLCDKLNEKRSKYRELRSKLCDHSMAVYKVKFYGNWKRELFPKHFPDWRPPAQWSKTYGKENGMLAMPSPSRMVKKSASINNN